MIGNIICIICMICILPKSLVLFVLFVFYQYYCFFAILFFFDKYFTNIIGPSQIIAILTILLVLFVFPII